MAATPPLTPTLELAKRWSEELGNTVVPIGGVDARGRPIVALRVNHGRLVVIIVERSPWVIEVDCPQDLPPEVKARLASLTPALRQQATLTFVQSLLKHPRSAFSFQPPPTEGLHQINKWVVTQVIRIDADDPSTQNRLADAIQEVVSVFMAAASVIAAAMNQPSPGAGGSSASPPPTNIPGYG